MVVAKVMSRQFASEQEFSEWNEHMFLKHTDDKCVIHPNPLIRFVEKKRLSYLLKFCKVKDNDKVLEVGCGSGYILDMIPNGELYGIDLSKTAIDLAQKKLKNKKNIKHLSIQAAEHMNFKDNSFDVVFCSEVIEHVPDPNKLVNEIFRVAKPDSRVVFTYPCEKWINLAKQTVKKMGLYKILLKGIPEHMEDEWHLTEFHPKLFKQIVRKNFIIKKMKGIPFFFCPLRYAALLKPKK